MLLKYLTELKKWLPNTEFNKFMKDVENDVKDNRIALGKRTSHKEFISICEMIRRTSYAGNNKN